MNINDVTSRAPVTFATFPSQQKQATFALNSQTIPGTVSSSDATVSSQPAQTIQAALVGAPPDTAVHDKAGEDKQLQAAVEKIQEFINKTARDINFSVDEDSGRTVVKVLDRETQEVIRQMPPQETLDLAKALDKLQGVLIKQKA
jgi:flagellar protein FlaG